MIYGPTRVDDHEKETAGSIMVCPYYQLYIPFDTDLLFALQSFFLQGGIISGLHFAFFFNWYANPDTFKDIFSGWPSGASYNWKKIIYSFYYFAIPLLYML